MKFFSLITVCYNCRRELALTFESVLAQDCHDFEYIVIDGASADDTVTVIKSYRDRFQANGIDFRWISEKDRGISDAFNKGIAMAQGEYVHLLNAGDTYLNHHSLAEIYDAIQARNRPEVIYGRMMQVNESGECSQIYGETFDRKHMWLRMLLAHPSTIVRRDFYEKCGGFNLEYRCAMDFDWVIRASRFTTPVFVDAIWTRMALGGVSDLRVYRAHRECCTIVIRHGRSRFAAYGNLVYRYLKTFIRLQCNKIGLNVLVKMYRKMDSRY